MGSNVGNGPASGGADGPLEPWAISEGDFPAGGTAAQRLRFLLGYAILAPSGHNTQPWLFRVVDEAVEVRADRTRALPVVDPEDRALIISCGAALATLRIASRRFGRRAVVEPMPDGGDEDLLARVSLAEGEPAGEDEEELFGAIAKRRSNRQAFEDRDLPGPLVERLVSDTRDEGVWLATSRPPGSPPGRRCSASCCAPARPGCGPRS
jgi:hypothetical protein